MWRNDSERMRVLKPYSLGEFANFPSIKHGSVEIGYGFSTKRLQQLIAEVLKELNERKVAKSLSVASDSGVKMGEMGFEVGVAEGFNFYYFDEETYTRLVESFRSKKPVKVLDLLIIVLYHYYKDEKKIPLNYDHHLLRLAFIKQKLQLSIYHVKGIRRIGLETLLNLLVEGIRGKVKKKTRRTITVERFETL